MATGGASIPIQFHSAGQIPSPARTRTSLRSCLATVFKSATEYRRLRRSGLIDQRFYATQEGIGVCGRLAPMLHYVMRGERRGLKPNLWFDPAYYRKQVGPHWCGRSELHHYLVAGADLRLNPSELVDADWYRFQNPDACDYPSPLLHLLRVGLPQFRDPSPLVCLVAVRELAAVRGEPFDAVLKEVVEGRCTCNACYRNLDELEAAQKAFFEKISLRQLQPRKAAPRRNLVFVQAGSRYAGRMPPVDRNWDLCLNWYDGGWKQYAGPSDIQFQQPGTKFTAIAMIFAECPEFFSDYERIWFVDDDIEFDAASMSRMFDAAANCRLDLAQPALTSDSHCVWPIFFQRPDAPAVRSTNGVEIMMPIISSRLLAIARPLLRETVSGFGLDFLLAMLAGRGHGGNIGVLNEYAVRHPMPIDPTGGDYYAFLRGRNINPKSEFFRLLKKFGTDRTFVEFPLSSRQLEHDDAVGT